MKVLLDRFTALGADASYHDPHVPEIGPTREHAFSAFQLLSFSVFPSASLRASAVNSSPALTADIPPFPYPITGLLMRTCYLTFASCLR